LIIFFLLKWGGRGSAKQVFHFIPQFSLGNLWVGWPKTRKVPYRGFPNFLPRNKVGPIFKETWKVSPFVWGTRNGNSIW